MSEKKFSGKTNLKNVFLTHLHQIQDLAQKEICFYFSRIKQYQSANKSKSGKHLQSRNIYFQQDHHSVFTILSNFQISKREFTSGKICALLFISLKYGAWQQFFSCNPGKNQRDKVKKSRKNEENEKALICFSVMFSCHNVFSGTIVFFKTIDHVIDHKRSIRTSIFKLF